MSERYKMLKNRSNQNGVARISGLMAVLGFCGLPAMHAAAVGESFDYADGLLEGSGSVGAWSGPWQAGPATDPGLGTTPFQVESGQLKIDYTDTPIYIYNDSDVERSLASSIATSSVYMSFEITPGEMGNVVPASNDDGYAGLNIAFADNATNIGSAGPMFSVYDYYSDFDDVSYVRFATSLDGTYDNTTSVVGDWTPGNTYSLVGRLDFDAVGLDEQWSVWLDPANEASTPQVVNTRDLGYSEIGVTQIWHYIYNFQNTQDSNIDDLRLGSSWQSVTAVAGDTDGNDKVEFSDFNTLANNYTGPNTGQAWETGDFDGDGDVTFADFNLLANNYGYDGTAALTASSIQAAALSAEASDTLTTDAVAVGEAKLIVGLDGSLTIEGGNVDLNGFNILSASGLLIADGDNSANSFQFYLANDTGEVSAGSIGSDVNVNGLLLLDAAIAPGDVNLNDLVFEYGTAAGTIQGVVEVVPEPTSLALLGLGGLLVARRPRS